MSLNNFCIKKNEGVNFAKYSGDNNSIHTDEIYGYNSIYGQNIVHGVLLILKFLITKKFKKNLSYIKVLFKEGTKYNHKIDIKKLKTSKEKILYELMQLNNIIAKIEIGFFPSNYQIQNLEKLSFQKEYFVKKKKLNKFISKSIPKELNIALCNLTKYAGTVFPEKNSLITEINISNTNSIQSHSVKICSDSSLLDKGFPIIENRLKYKNYNIQFKTIIRPELSIKLDKPKKEILKEIKLIKDNILIIGASSGIGNDLLKLFLYNEKINVIGTYYKNKILKTKKNLIIKKLNIERNLSQIYKIIKKYNPIIIYYFPTPKILFKSVGDKNLIKLYYKYFIDVPIKIIKFSNVYACKFFYPSTTYVNVLSPYSLIKFKAEKKIRMLNKIKTKINIVRIPGINTKQNLSLINRKLPNFRDLISKDKKIFNKVIFKN